MSQQEAKALGLAEAEAARAELYSTLGQLGDRLNYAKRIDDATARFSARIEDEKRERPVVFVAGVVVAAAAAGAVVWAVARKIGRNFR